MSALNPRITPPSGVGSEGSAGVESSGIHAAPRRPTALPRAGTATRPARSGAPTWRKPYSRRLVVTDAIVTACALFATGAYIGFSTDLIWPSGPRLDYFFVIAIGWGAWMAILAALDTRDEHLVGHGVGEYRRIVHASVFLFAALVVIAYFLRIDLSRLFFAISIPVGTAGLLLSRWLWRQWLRRRQRAGQFVDRAVIIGERAKIDSIARVINRTEGTGYQIVGAITAHGSSPQIAGQVNVLGDYEHIVEHIVEVGANTVIVASADDLDPARLRALSWQMADRDVAWVVAPAMTDIAGPRIQARPVAGLPLVEVDFPALQGGRRVFKRTTDIVGALLLIMLTSPIMLAAVVAIKLGGPGPILYRQERIGRHGDSFGMLKFRSMVNDADDQLASLLDLQGRSDRPLFKVTDDPRITRVGRFMRRHSIDELPQLFNVLRGKMSLVGPRPQRPAEVLLYDDTAHRRLILKPGMSGLWQVSGRSALSWEESLRLDLYYVENWSFVQDMVILFRTFRAVFRPQKTVI